MEKAVFCIVHKNQESMYRMHIFQGQLSMHRNPNLQATILSPINQALSIILIFFS